jgi:hypothetical protein
MLKGLTAAAVGLGVLATFSAQAASLPGKQYFSVGAGGGMLANGQPCPDLPCNGSDVCSCIQSSGTIDFSTTTKEFPSGTFMLELSADKSTAMPNGVGGQCYGSGGTMVLTTPKGTLTLQVSGPACRLGMGGGGPEAVPYGISIPATIVSGTGGYKNPMGTGTLSATFSPATKTVLLDLVGYGALQNSAPAE